MPTAFDLGELPEAERATAAAVAAACPGARPLRYADGEILIDAADLSRDMVLLLRGCALAIDPAANPGQRAGREIAVLEAQPGAPVFVGEMAALDAGARTATIVSAMTSWGLRLSAADLDTIIERFPDLTRILCRTFSERLRGAGEALRALRAGLETGARPAALAAETTLFRLGEAADRLWQLVEGEVRLEDANGARTIRPVGSAPCLLDLRAYLGGARHTATATAATACLAVAIGPGARAAVVRSHPDAVLALLAAG